MIDTTNIEKYIASLEGQLEGLTTEKIYLIKQVSKKTTEIAKLVEELKEWRNTLEEIEGKKNVYD